MNYFINKNYFRTLHEYDSMKISFQAVNKIILFQNDKIICLCDDILIFNIYEKNLLCNYTFNHHFNPQYTNIKLFGTDKFIIFNYNSSFDNKIRLFQFIEDKENKEYSFKQITRIFETAIDILIKGNKMICLKRGNLNIYNFINNQQFEFQTKIKIPKTLGKHSSNKALIISKNNLIIMEYKSIFVQFWSYQRNKLSQKNKIEFEKSINGNKFIAKELHNTDIILFGFNIYIYFYSFNNKEILYKIYISNKPNYNYFYDNHVRGIFISKNGDIFVNDTINIYYLDINNKNAHKLIRNRNKFGNVVMGYEQNQNSFYVTNFENEIKVFKSSKSKTIMLDLIYYFFTLLFISFLKNYFRKIKINFAYEILSSIIVTIPVFLYYKKMNFYSNIEDIIKSGRYIVVIIIIAIDIIMIVLFNKIFNKFLI